MMQDEFHRRTYTFDTLEAFAPLREELLALLNRLCPGEGMLLFVAVNEAVNNALFHGKVDGVPHPVMLVVECTEANVSIVVRDQGPGFPQKAGEDFLNEALEESGRGLCIMAHCADEVTFSARGNEVTLRKRRSST
jgi:serine/threonine-protein kinase RsbW